MPIKYRRITRNAIKIHIPDTVQGYGYSCGASALQAICRYFGVGPEEEDNYIRELRMDHRVGSHPYQIKRAARKYGLKVFEKVPMSVQDVKRMLNQGKPVMMMIQAWRENGGGKDYENEWEMGHWVIAIGYDRDGMYFEDPSLEAMRGFIPYGDLEKRWHDTGPRGRHLDHYGLALWKVGSRRAGYFHTARVID